MRPRCWKICRGPDATGIRRWLLMAVWPMDNGDYELAARVWLTLRQQDYWTPSTAAARLGYPLTLEQLASRELALQQYRPPRRALRRA